jgi:hypothetical protein
MDKSKEMMCKGKKKKSITETAGAVEPMPKTPERLSLSLLLFALTR